MVFFFIKRKLINKYSVKGLLFIFFYSLSQQMNAQITDSTTDDISYGTFYTVVSGTASVSLVDTPVRSGLKAFKHTVSGVVSKRAEIDGGFDRNDPQGTYWYGWSLYLPSADWNNATSVRQFIGQWRFSNLLQNGYTKKNCTTLACGQTGPESGSGHHLILNNGNEFEFTIRHFDPNCPDCEGTITEKRFIPGVVQDKWIDLVMQAKWTWDTDGFIKIWRNVDSSGYELVMEYYGRTWVRNFANGSALAGQMVYKPNWTVGLYYSNSGVTRSMYSDNLRESTTDQGDLCQGAFNEVNPYPPACKNITLGPSTQHQGNFRILPNIIVGNQPFKLEGLASATNELLIIDASGKVVFNKRVNSGELIWLNTNLATGIYLLNIQSGNKKLSGKLLITK
jgi:hypothetical protein